MEIKIPIIVANIDEPGPKNKPITDPIIPRMDQIRKRILAPFVLTNMKTYAVENIRKNVNNIPGISSKTVSSVGEFDNNKEDINTIGTKKQKISHRKPG